MEEMVVQLKKMYILWEKSTAHLPVYRNFGCMGKFDWDDEDVLLLCIWAERDKLVSQ